MDNPGDAKYGFTTEQMFEGFKHLKAKGAKHFGIHSFLASNTVTNDYYPTLARELFELAVQLKEKTGVHIAFINLSGVIGSACARASQIKSGKTSHRLQNFTPGIYVGLTLAAQPELRFLRKSPTSCAGA